MNEKQAESEGLDFTGIYNWSKEETQKRIKEERIERPKARIVQVNGDNGYSAYADNSVLSSLVASALAFVIFASILKTSLVIGDKQ